jgi:hypothetical protein
MSEVHQHVPWELMKDFPTLADALSEIQRLRRSLHEQNEYSLRLQSELERIRG